MKPILLLLLLPILASAAEGHDHGHDHGHGHGDEHGEPATEVTLDPATAAAFGIRVEPARARPLAELVLAPGRIEFDPDGRAVVGSPLAGRVTALPVAPGAVVAAGDPVAEITSPAWVAVQNALLLARAGQARAVLAREQAAQAVARGADIGAGLAAAERQRRAADLASAALAESTAATEVLAARATVVAYGGEPAAAALERGAAASIALVLRAPLGGTVIDRPAVLGQEAAGDLAVIADPARIRVLASVAASAAARVTVGSLAELLGADGGVLTDGDVVQVSPEIDAHTRTGTVRIQPTSVADLRPGMHVQVRITPLAAEAGPALVAVPEAAVVTIEGAPTVFIAGAAGVYIPRPVRIGPTRSGLVPILDGLHAGEPVVVAGTFILKADLGKSEAAHEH